MVCGQYANNTMMPREARGCQIYIVSLDLVVDVRNLQSFELIRRRATGFAKGSRPAILCLTKMAHCHVT
ncbi:unnamed protein product [Calypogeia fissa]